MILKSGRTSLARHQLKIAAPYALLAARSGVASYSAWLKSDFRPPNYNKLCSGKPDAEFVKKVISRWLRLNHSIWWGTKNYALCDALRNEDNALAERLMETVLRNRVRYFCHHAGISAGDKVRLDAFKKTFYQLSNYRKALMDGHWRSLSPYDQHKRWFELLAKANIEGVKSAGFSKMTFEEVLFFMRDKPNLLLRDLPSKLYERISKEGWLQSLQKEGYFVTFYTSAFGTSHRSQNELMAANLLHLVGANSVASIDFDAHYPSAFSLQVGHRKLRSDILIRTATVQYVVELSMYSSYFPSPSPKNMELKYTEKMKMKRSFSDAIAFHEGLQTYFLEIPTSIYGKTLCHQKFVASLISTFQKMKIFSSLSFPTVSSDLVDKLKASYSHPIVEREDAISRIKICTARLGLDINVVEFLEAVEDAGYSVADALAQQGKPNQILAGLSRLKSTTSAWQVKIQERSANLRRTFTDLKYGNGDPYISLAAAMEFLADARVEARQKLQCGWLSSMTRLTDNATGVIGLNYISSHGYFITSANLKDLLGRQVSRSIKRRGARVAIYELLEEMNLCLGSIVTIFPVPEASLLTKNPDLWESRHASQKTVDYIASEAYLRISRDLPAEPKK